MAADCKSVGIIPTQVQILDSGPSSGICIVVITSGFQPDEKGSIPLSRSNKKLKIKQNLK